MRTQRTLLQGLQVLLLIAAAASLGRAEESHGGSGHHPNHVGVFVSGATTNLAADQTSYTLGVDYERRLSPRFGVGVLGDAVFAHNRETILAATFVFHPSSSTRVFFAPGVLFEDGGDGKPFVARFGFAYEVPVRRISLAPTFSVDVIEGHVSLVYGMTLGFGF